MGMPRSFSSGLSAGSGTASDDATATAPAAMGPVGSGSQERLNSSDTAGTEGLLRSGSFTASSQSSKDSLGFAAGPQAQPAAAAGLSLSAVAEMGDQEQAQSVGWLRDPADCLAVGTSLQWLRLYDLRSPQRAFASVAAHPGTKVRGVRISPAGPQHIATFDKAGVVKLWDPRQMSAEKPVLSWAAGAPLIDVAWVPSAEQTLATLVGPAQGSEAGAVLLWSTLGAAQADPDADLEAESHEAQAASGVPAVPPAPPMRTGAMAEMTPARTIRLAARAAAPRKQAPSAGEGATSHTPTAFAWHPTEPRALVLAEGGQIAALTVRPPTALAWHGERLAIGFGVSLQPAVDAGLTDSVEETMRSRVLEGYAMQAEHNADITAPSATGLALDRHGVHFAWRWVERMEQLSESNVLGPRLGTDGGKRRPPGTSDKDDHPYHGVRRVIPA